MTIHLWYFREPQFPSVNLDLTMFKRIKNKKESITVYIQLFFAKHFALLGSDWIKR